MNYLNNIKTKENPTFEFHNKIYNDLFSTVTFRVDLDLYRDEISIIYWITTEIFKISFTEYYQNMQFEGNKISSKVRNSIFYGSIVCIASEISDTIMKKCILMSSLSFNLRLLLETMLFDKEVKKRNIPDEVIFDAAFASHNKQVGSKTAIIEELNIDNPGLFKVFNETIRLNKFAKKHNYEWLYKFLSGDNHLVSSASKLFLLGRDLEYNSLYFKTVKSFLFDVLIYVNSTLETGQDYYKFIDSLGLIDVKGNINKD